MKDSIRSEKDLAECLLRMPSPGGTSILRNLRSVDCWQLSLPDPFIWTDIPSSCDPCQLLDNAENTVRRHGTLDSQARYMQLGSRDAISQKPQEVIYPEADTYVSSIATQIPSQSTTDPATSWPEPSLRRTFKSTSRGQKKRWQVESFAVVLQHIINLNGVKPMHIVDFGCGSGALILPLASLYPLCTFTGVEMKPAALAILRRRADLAGLGNVRTHQGMIEDFREPFDVALALHACGNATDHVLLKSVRQRAAYIVSPCCVGKLKFSLSGGSSFSASLQHYTPRMPGDRPASSLPPPASAALFTARHDSSPAAATAAIASLDLQVNAEKSTEVGSVAETENDITENEGKCPRADASGGVVQDLQDVVGETIISSSSRPSSERPASVFSTSYPPPPLSSSAAAAAADDDNDVNIAEVLQHPRSEWLRQNLAEPRATFKKMAKIADRNHDGHPTSSASTNSEDGAAATAAATSINCKDKTHLGGGAPACSRPQTTDVAVLCKLHVEADRNEAAREQGFCVGLFHVRQADLMAKGDLLVGLPSEEAKWSRLHVLLSAPAS